VKLYLRGQLDVTGYGSLASLGTQPILMIGASPSGSFLDGMIDEVKLWTTVRTQAQIAAGMREPPVENEPGLIGYYRFDELRESWLEDSSSVGNHGRVTNQQILMPSDAPLCDASVSSGGAG